MPYVIVGLLGAIAGYVGIEKLTQPTVTPSGSLDVKTFALYGASGLLLFYAFKKISQVK